MVQLRAANVDVALHPITDQLERFAEVLLHRLGSGRWQPRIQHDCDSLELCMELRRLPAPGLERVRLPGHMLEKQRGQRKAQRSRKVPEGVLHRARLGQHPQGALITKGRHVALGSVLQARRCEQAGARCGVGSDLLFAGAGWPVLRGRGALLTRRGTGAWPEIHQFIFPDRRFQFLCCYAVIAPAGLKTPLMTTRIEPHRNTENCPTTAVDQSPPPEVGERTLLERLAAGDPHAVEACIQQFGPVVRRLARRYSQDAGEIEEAVQEVYVSLWQDADRFDPARGTQTAFVVTLTHRRLVDRLRRRMRRNRTVLRSDLNLMPGKGGDPSEFMEQRELEERIDGVLDRLRPEQRRVLVRACSDGQSQRQIADETELPLGTVKSHTRRGLRRLRQLLDPSTL